MRGWIGFGIVAVALLTLTAIVAADETNPVTLEGKIACAKCFLAVEGVTDCQSVLVVEEEGDGGSAHYYLVKNDVTEEYGHVCQGQKDAMVTGTVEKREGKLWLTASKMEPPEKA